MSNEMIFDELSGTTKAGAQPIHLTCPGCGLPGTFDIQSQAPTDITMRRRDGKGNVSLGHRVCPNPKCKGHVFVVLEGKTLLLQHPAAQIQFDATDIPPRIKAAFQEALTCHSHQCYVASGILIRKTLEVLCEANGAAGGNLAARLQDLRGKVILPPELFDGLDEMRLLGNDAAHVESKTYDNIGEPELEVAIEFTREVLKAVYQYKLLVSKIRSLKKQAT